MNFSTKNKKPIKVGEYYKIIKEEYEELKDDYICHLAIKRFKSQKIMLRIFGLIIAIVGVILRFSFGVENELVTPIITAMIAIVALTINDFKLSDKIEYIKPMIKHEQSYVDSLIKLLIKHKVGIGGFFVDKSDSEEDLYIVSVVYYEGLNEPLTTSFYLDMDGMDINKVTFGNMYNVCANGLMVSFKKGIKGKTLAEIEAEELENDKI